MSYKSAILSDNPIAYYKLDDYDGIAEDSSPCNNDGVFNGTQQDAIMTLVAGNIQAAKITNLVSVDFEVLNDYSTHQQYNTFATLESSPNPFSLECWIYPEIANGSVVPIIADSTNSVGIFWDSGNIKFAISSDSISYTVPYLNRSMYIVGVYTGSHIAIYLDGHPVAVKLVSPTAFENTSLSLSCGPTENSSDHFLANSFAIYRYALDPNQIKKHYDASHGIDPVQIVYADNGTLFHLYDDSISTKYTYSYPLNKSWKNFSSEKIEISQDESYIKMALGDGSAKTYVIEDFILIPSGIDIDSSVIEWDGNNGISVESSVDGETYVACENNRSIPQYNIDGEFSTTRKLYLKITMSTSDDSKYLPQLNYLSVAFYYKKRTYAYNAPDYFYEMTDMSGGGSEAILGNDSYSILSRDDRNGVRVADNAGFYISMSKRIKSIEFFYTPSSLATSGLVLVTTDDAVYHPFEWDINGSISKENILSIHVNGVDKTTETNISSLFTAKEIHHVVVAFESEIVGNIIFNYSSSGSTESLFQNIALYSEDISDLALQHYELYSGRDTISIQDSSLSLTESEVKAYNIDWKVVQTS